MIGHRRATGVTGFFSEPDGPGVYGRPNLTLEQVWGHEAQLWWSVTAPDGSGCSLDPKIHTVHEHIDGTITVEPSIVTSTWHGWLERGIWRSV